MSLERNSFESTNNKDTNLYLGPQDNLVNQAPFMTLPDDVKNFGNILKSGSIEPEQLSFFLYYFLREKPQSLLTSTTAHVNLIDFVNEWKSPIVVAATSVLQHLETQPYAREYLKFYYSQRRYKTNGLLYYPSNTPAMWFTEFQRRSSNARLVGMKDEFRRRG